MSSKFSILILLIVTAIFSTHASAQNDPDLMPGFFHEFAASQGRGAVTDLPQEIIDPFSGVLNLVHHDIVIPGNGGMDLVLNRVYSSNAVYRYGLNALAVETQVGRGWSMHLGRVVMPGSCYSENSSTYNNPIIETSTGSQKQAHKNRTNLSDADYMTLDHWVIYCQSGGSMLVIDPEGTQYTMDEFANLRSTYNHEFRSVWYPTKIEDRNGNYFTITYESDSYGDSLPFDSIDTSDGRSIDFSYYSSGRLKKASSGGRSWDYTYNSSGNLTRVTRPIGQWDYSYYTSGYKLLKSITHPWGGEVDYEYEDACLSIATCVYSASPGQYQDAYSLVVTEKTVSGPSLTNGTWDFSYSRSGDYDTTTVDFNEGKIEYRHYSKASEGLWRAGKLESKKTYEGNSLVKTESYTYEQGIKINDQENKRRPYIFGVNYEPEMGIYAARMTSRTIRLDGTNYTTTYSNFTDGINPRRIVESGQNSKTTNLTYFPRNDGQNIVSLTKNEDFGGISETITRTFDSDGNLINEIRYGVQTSYVYDSVGNISRIIDARNKTTYLSNYYRGVARTESQPESVTLTRQVNAFGAITRETNGEGETTSYTLDDLDRVTRITYPMGDPLTISWSTNASIVRRGDFRADITHDGFGKEVCNEYEGIAESKRYSTTGVLIFSSLPAASCSSNAGQTFSDVLGRLEQVRFEDGETKTYNYASGNKVTMTDERNKDYTFTYRSFGDPSDRAMTKITGPESLLVEIGRNKLGQATSVKRNGVTRNYTYTKTFLTSENNPETGQTTYSRDNLGNMTAKQVGGQRVDYRYDDRNRLTAIDYPGSTPDVNYTYDENDNLTRMQSGITDFRYSYDDNDNLTQERQIIDGKSYYITYRYNGLDHLTTMEYPDGGNVSFNPNDLGWPTQASPHVTNVTYTSYGQPTGISYQNGRTTTLNYNNRNWVTRSQTNGSLFNRSYTHDDVGNVTTMNDALNNAHDRSLSYDDLNRLTGANGPWGSGSINYSSTDEIDSKNMGTNQFNYVNNSSQQISQVSGLPNFITPVLFNYDGRGNITEQANATQGWTYEYDAASNLRQIFKKDGTLEGSFDYSGDRMRVRTVEDQETRIYIHTKNGQLINEFVTQGEKPNLAYVHAGSILVAELESNQGPVAPATIYGWGYGNSDNKYSYTKTFTLDEIPETVKFCVDGYGINSATEVSVTVNGVLIGYLLPGGDDTPRETCFEIPANLLNIGNNQITFTQATPNETWGVGAFEVIIVNGGGFLPPIILLLLDDEEV